MRIAYLTNARLPTEKAHGLQISKMCEAFSLNGHDVHLFHMCRSRSQELKESIFEYYSLRSQFADSALKNIDITGLIEAVPLRALRSGLNLCHYLAWTWSAARAIQKMSFDLHYTREIYSAYWLTKLGLKTILELHRIPDGFQRTLLRKVAGSPHLIKVITMTSCIEAELSSFAVKETQVFPDCIDESLLDNIPSQEQSRSLLQLPPEKIILSYVGRFLTFEDEKGIPMILEAIGKLPVELRQRCLFLFVGGPMSAVPAYKEMLRQNRIEEAFVTFHDKVAHKDVMTWLRASDIAFLCSPPTKFYSYYASPLKLFEYLAAGLPILATRLPALEEVLDHDRNAWFIDQYSPHAIAEGIQRLVTDAPLRQKLSTNALADIHQYTWTRRAREILKDLAL